MHMQRARAGCEWTIPDLETPIFWMFQMYNYKHTHIAASLDYWYALTCPIASCGKLSSMPSYNRASSLSSSDFLCWSTSISNCFQPRNASNGKNIEYLIMLCNTRGERCISTCYTVFRINMIVQLASASTNTAACNELLHAGSAYYTYACA